MLVACLLCLAVVLLMIGCVELIVFCFTLRRLFISGVCVTFADGCYLLVSLLVGWLSVSLLLFVCL